MTDSKWVMLLHLFARHSHYSCCIPWLTASEWHCSMCLPGILINHVASHDQQHVSHIASFVCQAVSLIISDPMTNRKCVLHLFARQSPQSCCISWPTASEWHCIICLPGRLMLHPMTNSEWVTLLHLFARQAHQSCCIPWPTASEWNCFISLPGRLMHHVASHDQQRVSDTASCVTITVRTPHIMQSWLVGQALLFSFQPT